MSGGTVPPTVGLVLPTLARGASSAGVEAAADVAERVGWRDVWVPDHVLVDRASAAQYGHVLDPIVTLAHVAARHPALGVGTSVLIVPMRNAVVLAKELATLDLLTGGRLSVGVGVGWIEGEFRNLGAGERFRRRGAYLEEAIRLWRHLWSGSQEPVQGRFHPLDDFAFGPMPAQGAALPIWIGGRVPAAVMRAGRLGDGYMASQTSPDELVERRRWLESAAAAARRATPPIAVRTVLSAEERSNPGSAVARIDAYGRAGADRVIVSAGTPDPEVLVPAVERLAEALESRREA